MNIEVWKDIIVDNYDYSNKYQISNLKRIRNDKGIIMKHYSASLCKDGKYVIHRIQYLYESLFEERILFYFISTTKVFITIKELEIYEWKKIPIDERYEACCLGIIRRGNKYLNPNVCKTTGYVNSNIAQKTYKLHRLIAMYF